MKPATRGFLPDFSRYLRSEYPLNVAYQNSDLIAKLCRMLGCLPIIKNPAQDMQTQGLCKKLEKFKPCDKKERTFISKCNFQEGQIYYATYGNNAYRIVFGIDSNERKAYFFALDTNHSIRNSK